MNRKTLAPSMTMLLIAAAAISGAHAQTSMPRTRDQVRQELVEAVRNGTIARGEQDASMREMSVAAGRTRAEVRAEFATARKSGDLLASGESSLTLNELHTAQHPPLGVVGGKTRAQVLAELADAQRTGETVAAGELGPMLNATHPGVTPRASMPAYASASMPATNRVAP